MNVHMYVRAVHPPEPLKNQTGTSQGGGGVKKSRMRARIINSHFIWNIKPPPHTHTKQPVGTPHRHNEEHSECTDLHTLVLLFALPPWRNLYGFFSESSIYQYYI